MFHFLFEHTHDFAQWLFSIPEAERFNGFASLIEKRTIKAFRSGNLLLTNQTHSF